MASITSSIRIDWGTYRAVTNTGVSFIITAPVAGWMWFYEDDPAGPLYGDSFLTYEDCLSDLVRHVRQMSGLRAA